MPLIDPLIAPLLVESEVVILDGAMATELEKQGASLKDSLWSAKILIDQPALIRQVHLDYLRAGAQIITTASYQASFEGFAKKGLSDEQTTSLINLSTRLAVEARDLASREKGTATALPLVAASVGPYGAYLADGSEYRGNYGLSVEDLKVFHRRRIQALAASGADLLAFETIPCIDEARALGELLNELPGTKAWLSYSCRNESVLNSGEPWEDAVRLANNYEGLIAVGVNCSAPPFIESLLAKASRLTTKILLTYPNRGESWDAVNKCWIPADAHSEIIDLARAWKEAGASMIGGCCRTGPEDIRRLRDLFSRIAISGKNL